MKIQNAYIVDAARTAIAKVKQGKSAYDGIHPVDLAAKLVSALAERNNLKEKDIDFIEWAVTSPVAQQGLDMARQIGLIAFGEKVPGAIVNYEGGGGTLAVVSALSKVNDGLNDIEIAGGSEDMSLIPLGADGYPIVKDEETLKKVQTEGMKVVLETMSKTFHEKFKFKTVIESADLIAKKYLVTREEADQYALSSHKKAQEAWDKGYYKNEVIPIQTTSGLFEKDDGIRADTTIEKLKLMKTILDGGIVTPGNASQISVGAAATIIANEDAIKVHNLTKRAKLISFAVTGSSVEEQLTGPMYAIQKVLNKAGLKIENIDLFQIVEAFATEVLAVKKVLDIPEEKLNIYGGAISIGHPPGATGVNLIISGLNELERRYKEGLPNNKYLLVSLCIGFGQGIAAIFERIDTKSKNTKVLATAAKALPVKNIVKEKLTKPIFVPACEPEFVCNEKLKENKS